MHIIMSKKKSLYFEGSSSVYNAGVTHVGGNMFELLPKGDAIMLKVLH